MTNPGRAVREDAMAGADACRWPVAAGLQAVYRLDFLGGPTLTPLKGPGDFLVLRS